MPLGIGPFFTIPEGAPGRRTSSSTIYQLLIITRQNRFYICTVEPIFLSEDII